MRKATPSLNALRAFECAARHESFAEAAKELRVSASAVSQHVSQLEFQIGVQLFERAKQRLKLTVAGTNYRASLSSALDRIETATMDLISQKGIRHLRIGCLPSLASYWLIPRLPGFTAACPSIKLHIVTLELDFATPERAPNFEGGRVDIGLFYGDGHWDGIESEKFLDERLVPVVAPELLTRFGVQANQGDIIFEQLPLLRHSTRPGSWSEWFQTRGSEALSSDGPCFEHFHMLIDGAKAGLGVALVPYCFVEKDLQKECLVRVGDNELCSKRAYYVLRQANSMPSKSSSEFCKWLRSQVN